MILSNKDIKEYIFMMIFSGIIILLIGFLTGDYWGRAHMREIMQYDINILKQQNNSLMDENIELYDMIFECYGDSSAVKSFRLDEPKYTRINQI